MFLRHAFQLRFRALSWPSHSGIRFFTSTRAYKRKETRFPPRPTVLETDLVENFLKGSGPGGQKINKTSSAVQLKHLPTGLVVKSQATRSRSQNRKIARVLLAERVEEMEKGPASRVMLKAEIKKKKKASSTKKSRRKYRTLMETQAETENGKFDEHEMSLEQNIDAETKSRVNLPMEGVKKGRDLPEETTNGFLGNAKENEQYDTTRGAASR